MRNRAPWALSLALLAGVGALAVAQDPQPTNPANQNNGNGSPSWLPFGQPAQKKTPAAPPKTPPVVITVAMQRDREKKAFFRRCEVCEKLKDIAWATKDADLERRVDQLREQVYETYLQHMALLPMDGTTDDRSLANHLSPNDSGNRLAEGSQARPVGSAVSQAPTREEGR